MCVKHANFIENLFLLSIYNVKMKPLEVFVYAFTIRKEGKRGKETNKPKNMKYAKVTKFVFVCFPQ